MNVVLDACAALKVLLKRLQAESIWQMIANTNRVIAPTLYQAEITNVIAKYVKASYITEKQGVRCITLGLGLVDEFHDIAGICTQVFHESVCQKHSAYDLFYLLLTQNTNSIIVSLDRKLLNLARFRGIATFENK